MTKKIILAGASALILLVIYWLYNLHSGPVAVPARQARGPVTSLPADLRSATQPTARITRAGVPVGPSDRVFFEWFDRDGRKSGEWRAEHATPAGPSQFDLDRPEAVLYTGDGQIIRVKADQGEMVVDEAEGRLDPKRGRLWDQVVLTIDRSTEAWRQANPQRAGAQQHPHLLVRIELDDLSFDRDLGKVWTQGPVNVMGQDLELAGEGLLLRWNELLGRLDFLRIEQGHRLVYRSQSPLLAAEETAGTAAVGPGELPDTGHAFAITEPPPISLWPGPPNFVWAASEPALDEEPPGKETQPAYRATFAGPVTVRTESRDRPPAGLLAGELTAIFDLAQRVDSGAAGGPRDRLQPQPSGEIAATIEITWNGPLDVRPAPAPVNRTGCDRLFIAARGDPVRLQDEHGQATAATLVYDQSQGRLWLMGSKAGPVSLAEGESRRLVGQEVLVDQLLGQVQFAGPGRMEDTGSEQSGEWARMNVSWQEAAELYLAARPTGERPQGSAVDLLGGQYVRRAIFRGDVDLHQADQGLQAQAVEARFDPPAEEEGPLARPTELVAIGRVRLDFGPEEMITCERLRAQFARDALGESYPQVAYAVGKVLARQETRTLSAGRMRVALDRLAEADGERRLAVMAADAYENVLVSDPVEPIDIDAEQVHCALPSGRELEQVQVIAAEGQVAHVRVGQRAIRGRRVDLDLARGEGQVPGPGWLSFVSDRDLEGRRQAEPAPVEIEWSDGMELTGAENILTFAGDVRARSQTNQVRCSRLTVEFVDEMPGEEPAQPKALWVLDPIGRRLGAEPESRPEGATVSVSKRPVYLQADVDVVLVSEDFGTSGSAAGRVIGRRRIDGSTVTVDLAEERFQVVGPGHLLVEDYRQPAQKRPPAAGTSPAGWTGRVEPRDPLLEDLSRRGPSQTLFAWGSSMSYSAGSGLAVFDEHVRMKHLWGSKMVLSDELLGGQEADGQAARQQPGGEASLVCDHLLVGLRSRGEEGADTSAWGLGSGRLDRLVATGRVHLQEGALSLEGTRLAYWGASNLVELEGSGELQASLYDTREDGTYRSFQAPWMRWHRQNGQIEAAQAVITQTGP